MSLYCWYVLSHFFLLLASSVCLPTQGHSHALYLHTNIRTYICSSVCADWQVFCLTNASNVLHFIYSSYLYIYYWLCFSPRTLFMDSSNMWLARQSKKSSIALSLYRGLCFQTVIKALALEPFFVVFAHLSQLHSIFIAIGNCFWNLAKVICQSLLNSRFGQLLHFWPYPNVK